MADSGRQGTIDYRLYRKVVDDAGAGRPIEVNVAPQGPQFEDWIESASRHGDLVPLKAKRLHL